RSDGNAHCSGRTPKLRPTRNLSRADVGGRPPAKGHSLEGSVLRFGAQLGHRRVWVALFRAVELRDSPQMNFGDTNFVVAVLLLFLFLRNELAIAELAFHRQMCAFPESRRKRREIAPSDELVPFRAPDIAVAVFVFPR